MTPLLKLQGMRLLYLAASLALAPERQQANSGAPRPSVLLGGTTLARWRAEMGGLAVRCPAPQAQAERTRRYGAQASCIAFAGYPHSQRPVLFVIGLDGATEDTSRVVFVSFRVFAPDSTGQRALERDLRSTFGAPKSAGDQGLSWDHCGKHIELRPLSTGGFSVVSIGKSVGVQRESQCTL
jgi:hypothetical protein